ERILFSEYVLLRDAETVSGTGPCFRPTLGAIPRVSGCPRRASTCTPLPSDAPALPARGARAARGSRTLSTRLPPQRRRPPWRLRRSRRLLRHLRFPHHLPPA